MTMQVRLKLILNKRKEKKNILSKKRETYSQIYSNVNLA